LVEKEVLDAMLNELRIVEFLLGVSVGSVCGTRLTYGDGYRGFGYVWYLDAGEAELER
tara:strand:- start:2095 stop:2268 length:174 start_codon:yes stop_codon:yes gene_type:complete